MPALVMLSPAPVIETAGGEVVLDIDFVEGIKLHGQFWPGRLCCVMWRGATRIDRGLRFAPARLGFDLVLLDPGEAVPEILFDEAGLIYASIDDMRHLHLPERLRGRLARLVYTVEQPLSGRIQAALRDPGRMLPRRLRSVLWTLRREPRLRAALKAAHGVHCNGLPAHSAYRRLNGQTLAYLDNRLRRPMLARPDEMAARAERLRAGAPLSLVYFGPLDAVSGVMDLLAVAHIARAQGLRFSLDIHGAGPMEGRLRDGIAAMGLSGCMRLAEPAGFDARLVPKLRGESDLFLLPRKLGDPLPAYVEAMGCGLPVLGYRQGMLNSILRRSRAGWACGQGPSRMACMLLRLDADREALIAASTRAVAFARETPFETVFAQRMEHLRQIAGLE